MFRGKLTVRRIGDLLLVPSAALMLRLRRRPSTVSVATLSFGDLKDEIEPQPQAMVAEQQNILLRLFAAGYLLR
ncbi:MAG: hypothetical protein ACLRXQ_03105 [Phascolarctobacterium faecium]